MMRFTEATPTRYERSPAFVTRERGCSLEDVRRPVFIIGSQAQGLTRRRKELGLGLRDAAARLGMRAVELSGLEHGRLVPVDREEWARMIEQLGGAP